MERTPHEGGGALRPPRPDRADWLRHAVGHIPVGLAVVDADGTILDANPALGHLLAEGDLRGRGVEEWMDGDEWSQVRDAVRAAIRPPHAAAGFDVRLRLEGGERWAHLSLSPVHDDGHHAAALLVEPAEVPVESEERQALSWRREVLQWSAEDAQDPVTPLVEGLAALRAGAWGPLSPEQRERVAGLQVFGHRMEVLFDEVRCASAIARGTFSVHKEWGDLRGVVHEASNLFREAADDAGVEYRVRAQTPMPCRLDAWRVRHVLETLLENALRFSPFGSTVSVEAAPTYEAGGGYRVTVTDEGPGLDEAQQRAVWEPFSQVHGGHGVGLGLFVARNTVEAHGGTMTVRSTPGHGTTFAFTLPA